MPNNHAAAVQPTRPSRTQNQDPDRVYIASLASNMPLLPGEAMAEQIAQANGTVVLAQADATYTANQVIAVFKDGRGYKAKFMRTNAMFTYYQDTDRVTPSPFVRESSGNLPYPPMKFVRFVKFVGANLLAGVKIPR